MGSRYRAELLQEAVAGLGRELGENHWRVAVARRNLGGEALTAQKRYEEAEEHLRYSVEVLTESRGGEAAATQDAQQWLDALYKAWGRPERMAPQDGQGQRGE